MKPESKDLLFQVIVPKKPEGESISLEEAEEILLKGLNEARSMREIEKSMWALARFYSKTGRQIEAFDYVKKLLDRVDDPEKAAACYLALGQIMETGT